MAKKSKYRNIPLFPKTKLELEEIRHELEGRSQKKRLSFDDVVSQLMKDYKDAHPTKFEREEKPNQKKNDGKSSLDNVKVGDLIPDLHNEEIEITDDLLEQMKIYEQETSSYAIYRNKITGKFIDFKGRKEKKSKKSN
ncbi:hypothetical protein LCGC14_2290040 [marine sediment metagenome]|uniref:Uncharacterized protein n=1 Tax=marine sediment metagenome TaxID=412755 RepID=A0A0F9DE25_9ZZZZ